MKRSVIIAVIIALAAVIWLGSGIFQDEIQAALSEEGATRTAESSEPTTTTTPAPAAPPAGQETVTGHGDKVVVQTETNRAEVRTVDVVLRGRTESVRTVDLMAETSGSVVDIYKAKGEKVKKGDAIVRLSTQDREARRLEAVAAVKQRQIERDAAVKLAAKGFKSDTAVAAAEAQLDAAQAALTRVNVEISQLTIRAPFDGTIAKRQVQLGSFLGIGDPVATIVDRDPILVVGNVAEREVGRIEEGAPATATLVGGMNVSGKVRFIAPTADPATRTFRVEVEVGNADGQIRDGITAEIRLAAGKAPAHRISPAVLTLNDKGVVGIRAVGPGKVVRFMPVEILSEGPEGVWVGGLPETVEVITVGQEYVNDGEIVEVASN
ncbi:MAG: efflux RND transporter periplasmic adaptor subunit [Minwuia sp.]|uniref:efflux RND transporter periplasmic adaptor subunit n=1 Tax=Minwuia sp. TaxID=2493630 RepID=UPI003A855F47